MRKRYIYRYFNKIRLSPKLMTEYARNIEGYLKELTDSGKNAVFADRPGCAADAR